MVFLQISLVVSVMLFILNKQIKTFFMDINYEMDSYKEQLIQKSIVHKMNEDLKNQICYSEKSFHNIERSHSTEPNSDSCIYSDDNSNNILMLFEQSLNPLKFKLLENQLVSSINYIVRQK
ncbi:Hypothetical_protein [Hexamita inflata]|uniref:Hypothetical_protein n=1 Tax=Hexamita inflata TaxID=28002 RepID=A0AA86QCU7_9EUKA|nr:Hypothetical protein HINF_LOCUS38436 [Hexamita inflata]CAI9950792.1 Hypothetical protein HINF_LOCUS38437 [Hexamita inflata]